MEEEKQGYWEFTITITAAGTRSQKNTAWEEAVIALAMEPGLPPEDDECVWCEEDECPQYTLRCIPWRMENGTM